MTNTKRVCRKCQQIIPCKKYEVGGRVLSLANRKYCLECKPHRSERVSLPKNKSQSYYQNNKGEWKRKYVVTLYKRALTRKIDLILAKGGRCQKCGYNKCLSSLVFHHRDASTKLFGLSVNNLWSKSMQEVQTEADKCDILCMNCHQEHHYDDSKMIAQIKHVYGIDLEETFRNASGPA